MRVLVLNVGSSSLKFDVFDTVAKTSKLTGDIQHITTDAHMKLTHDGAVREESLPITSHREAIPVINTLVAQEGLDYEAARRLARWVLACHPGLRDKYPLHCKLGMGRPL